MVNRKTHILLFIVLAVAVTLAGCYRKTPEQRAQGVVDHIVEKLKLDDAQKTKVYAMKEEFMAKGPAMKKTREETFDQLIAMMRAPSADQARLKTLADQNKSQADDLIGFIFTKFGEFHQMLTPEQREMAAKEMEHWREQYRKYNKEGEQK